MGANAHPSGNPGGGNGGGTAGNQSNGAAASGGGAGTTAAALKHNPGLALEWTVEEQSILEEFNTKYASDSSMIRYAKIAMQLQDKTVRDIALRCRWMSKKESGKRRKDDHNLSRKNKDKKERASDASAKPSTNLGPRPNISSYALPMLPIDDDDVSFTAIGGRTGQLLENNADAFNKISTNFAGLKIQDNINLFCQTRDNILAIMQDLSDMPEIMRQMPQLPVKINEELANSILPRTNVPMQT